MLMHSGLHAFHGYNMALISYVFYFIDCFDCYSFTLYDTAWASVYSAIMRNIHKCVLWCQWSQPCFRIAYVTCLCSRVITVVNVWSFILFIAHYYYGLLNLGCFFFISILYTFYIFWRIAELHIRKCICLTCFILHHNFIIHRHNITTLCVFMFELVSAAY